MKRLVNCSSYDFIKRSLCTVVAGAFVLSAASCNQLTSDQTKDSLNVNSEESSDTTSSEETSKAVNLTFEEVQKTVLEKLEYDESDLKKPNEEDMIKNSYIGIVNMVRLNPPHFSDSESSDTKEDDVLVRADILEFDTNSFEYRNLKVGDEVSFFSGFGFPVGATVSAINGKFVICLCGTKGESGTDSHVFEVTPDYTLGNLQEIYEAFAKLPEVFSKPADKPEITFDYVFAKMQGNLGSSFMNYTTQSSETAENNKSVGILNFVYIWLDYPGEGEGENATNLQHYARVFEFDADSDEYRKLKVGEKFDYYYGSEKKECVVTAINGKFVIAFSVYKTPVGNLKERTEQTEPEFADKGMQKAYNAFVSI